MKELIVQDILINALKEDMPYGDMTTDYLIPSSLSGFVEVKAKESGVIAGLDVFRMVFRIIDPKIRVSNHVEDGDLISKGDVFITISGSTNAILKGERLALNLLQRLSGIATQTRQYCEAIKDLPTVIVDTRKTTPGLRLLEKMAVQAGGASLHRYNLSDAVMIKDNHIKACGNITQAVSQVRNKIPFTTKVEVEVSNLEEFKEALATSTDIIMLDNMTNIDMKSAVEMNKGKCILEASGNMNLERIRSVALTGVDYISVGALTHSVKSLDISLNLL
ncbi:carboxylating nicotinate-nucleotide diphosphorylase [Vallitalea okinawensis]|uniref:carboxylating nicotinate-nucleotide diphosphorylase n=1 Tax=Vallitalea okinawensis TaxID=2078660 RepID=UPI000CFD777D|nr:carboxylating nicotinate-nucleotide diphosphorylase [Vallitalea okinawensis]